MKWEQKSRPNPTAKIPYAYKASEDDPLVLLPDQEQVEVVEQAFVYLENGHSLRETAHWVSEQTGVRISHQGISNLWRMHRGGDSKRQKDLNKQNRKRKPKTASDKAEAKLKRRISDAKRMRTMAENKLKEKQKPEEGLMQPYQGVSEGLDFEATPKEREIIFKPNAGTGKRSPVWGRSRRR